MKEKGRQRERERQREWGGRKGEIVVGWRGQTGFSIISACTGSQLKLAF